MANEPEESHPERTDEGGPEKTDIPHPDPKEGGDQLASGEPAFEAGGLGESAQPDYSPVSASEGYQADTPHEGATSLTTGAHESEPDLEEEEDGGPVKSFLEHLEDLRWVMIRCGASLLVAMVACLAGSPFLVSFLTWPLQKAGVKTELDFLGPIGGVVSSMKIALYGGLCISLPFILFFIAHFVMPALKLHEKKYFRLAFIIGGGLFLLGVMLCYFFVLPITIMGMVQFNQWMGVESKLWRAEEYFSFVTTFMLGMGVSFEIPVLLLTLVKLGLIQHEWLLKGRKYFFVINLTLCAFITPDFLSTFFMVIPVQVLMEICILISAHWERQKGAGKYPQ